VFICVLYRSYAFSFKKIPMHNFWEKDRLFPQKVSVLIISIFMFSVFQIGTDSILSAYVGQAWLHTRGEQGERWRNGGGVVTDLPHEGEARTGTKQHANPCVSKQQQQ
jgi:hypothetical protein